MMSSLVVFFVVVVMDWHAVIRGSIPGGDGVKTELHVLRKVIRKMLLLSNNYYYLSYNAFGHDTETSTE